MTSLNNITSWNGIFLQQLTVIHLSKDSLMLSISALGLLKAVAVITKREFFGRSRGFPKLLSG
jgi:hypothetical protein